MCHRFGWFPSITTAKLGKNYKITIFLADKICQVAIFFMLNYRNFLHFWVVCNLHVAIQYCLVGGSRRLSMQMTG